MTSDCDSRQIAPKSIVKADTRPDQLLTVDMVQQAGHWDALGIDDAVIAACAHAVASSSAWTCKEPASATVALSTDANVQQLNKIWRNKDLPTNVLAFPTPPAARGEVGLYLGDVILALETIQTEAFELGIPQIDHCKHLIVHGLLHLLGYDHQSDTQAETMEQFEVTILATLGVADPYSDLGDAKHESGSIATLKKA